MVPSLERSEYMYELREIAANIVMERCKHGEVSLGLDAGHVDNGKVADVTDDVEPHGADVSPSQHEDVQVGPAFHIPMTQEKTLHDLPSQLDIDWQESASQGPIDIAATARNLTDELDVASTLLNAALPVHVEVDTFVQVSQIAHEAVMDANQQPSSTITTNTADASNI